MPPRLIRRQSLAERVSGMLNPFDLFLALSIWMESHDWDNLQSVVGNPLGVTLNVLCLISRANSSGGARRSGAENVLRRPAGGYYTGGDGGWGSGLSYFFWILSWVLAAGSVVNAIYCFSRKRRYRLFESNIEIEPTTPSARRVRVDSSPTTASPLYLFRNIMESFTDTAESRQYPDETRDVWEVSVWDPTPLSLRLFAMFSPVHVFIYFLTLPMASSPSFSSAVRASVVAPPATSPVATIFMVIATQIVLSAQLIYTQMAFTQQAKDARLIHKEVLHEYDQKYVHPRLNVLKRDVAVQTANYESGEAASVAFFTPNPNRQGFRTAPNANYAELTMQNKIGAMRHTPPASMRSSFSPMLLKGSMRQPQFGTAKRSASTSTSMNESGSFGTEYGYDDAGTDGASTAGRAEERHGLGTPGMPRSSASNLGMQGLVNMSRENSKNITPSKMNSPLRKGYAARGSSYAGSLGTPLGGSIRRSNNGY